MDRRETYLTTVQEEQYLDWKKKPSEIIAEASLSKKDKSKTPFHADSYYTELVYYAERIHPTQIVFLHNTLRGHWVGFLGIQDDEDVANAMVCVSQYLFKIGDCTTDKKQPANGITYIPQPLRLQNDGSNCGFWACTFALLLACRLPPNAVAVRDQLQSLGIKRIKGHLRRLWFSRYLDRDGIPVSLLQEFLRDLQGQAPSFDHTVMPRPPWIHVIVDEHFDRLSAGSVLEQPSNVQKQALVNISVSEIETTCQRLEESNTKLVWPDRTRFGGSIIYAYHLRQLGSLKGWVHDEIINAWAEVLDWDSGGHISVPTNHFSNKLQTSYTNWHNHGGNDTEEWWKLAVKWSTKWFKHGTTTMVLLPIHVPAHWILAQIDLEARHISIFDSWQGNSSNASGDWRQSTHARIILMLRTWFQKLHEQFNAPVDWTLWEMDISPPFQSYQINSHDCGIYTCFTMALLCKDPQRSESLNQIITPWAVQMYRFFLFHQLLQEYTEAEIVPGEDTEYDARIASSETKEPTKPEVLDSKEPRSPVSEKEAEVKGEHVEPSPEHPFTPPSSLTALPPSPAPPRLVGRKQVLQTISNLVTSYIQNVTIGLMASNISDEAVSTTCVRSITEVVYKYTPSPCEWGPYAAAAAASLIGCIFGLSAMWANQTSLNTSFTTMIHVTRNPALDAVPEQDPSRIRLRYGLIDNDAGGKQMAFGQLWNFGEHPMKA
ncbi:hypothetical protein C8F01DRAFT_1366145 [Mycena amicta]|nr:hypothetical protein C8F01DRAFT_1366145 [Mycena amicta]